MSYLVPSMEPTCRAFRAPGAECDISRVSCREEIPIIKIKPRFEIRIIKGQC